MPVAFTGCTKEEAMTRHGINPVLHYVQDSWDDGDKWGSALSALFAIAEVMDAAWIQVPEELEFRRSPLDNRTVWDMADESQEQDLLVFDLATAYLAGNINAHDMRLAALTLNRYCDMCRAAGLDY
jgi:hypothetical protein